LKKRTIAVVVFLISLLLIVGCSDVNNNDATETSNLDMKQLFKVDVQKINSDGSNGKHTTITDENKLNLLGKAFGEIEWHQNIESAMERREDIIASLFYDFDKDMEPKKLADYEIWFNSEETATIIMDGIYGRLDNEC
jgi:hypothetical protein